MVRRQDNDEEVRATASNLGVKYKPGTVVICVNPGASGLNRNTGLTIIGFPGVALRNASGAPITADSFATAGSAVFEITPNPVKFNPGQMVAVTIRGVGFTAAPTYTSALLANASPAVVTPTLITLSVKADPTIPFGTYGLVLDKKTYNVFQVSKLSGHVYYLERHGLELKKLNPTDGTLIASAAVVSAFGAAMNLADATSYLYLSIQEGGTFKVRRINKSDLSTDNTWSPGGADLGEDSPSIFVNSHLYWATGTGGFIRKFDPVSGTLVANTTLSFSAIGLVWDGTWLWFSGGAKLAKVNPTDLSFTEYTLTGESPRYMTTDGTYLYAVTADAGAGNAKILKIDKTTQSVIATYIGLTDPKAVQYHEGNLLVTNKRDTDPGEIVKVQASDMTHVQTVSAGHIVAYSALVTELGLLWVTSGSFIAADNVVSGFDASDLSKDYTRTHSVDGDTPWRIIRGS